MAHQSDSNPLQTAETALEKKGFSFDEVQSKDLPPMLGLGALVLYGISRRSLGGLFLAGVGGGLLYRQLQQKNVLPDKSSGSKNKSTSSNQASQIIELEESIIVQQPIEDVFAFWSDLQNIPRFMEHIKNVQKLDDTRSRWQAFIPFTSQVIEWDAEITEFQPNELIRWQSVPDSDLFTRGTVRFQRLPNGNGTHVDITICYRPPAKTSSQVATQFLTNIPSDAIRSDLERFRNLLESAYNNGGGVIDNDISF